MIKKSLIVVFTLDVVYEKTKRLVYTPSDLLAGFVK